MIEIRVGTFAVVPLLRDLNVSWVYALLLFIHKSFPPKSDVYKRVKVRVVQVSFSVEFSQFIR